MQEVENVLSFLCQVFFQAFSFKSDSDFLFFFNLLMTFLLQEALEFAKANDLGVSNIINVDTRGDWRAERVYESMSEWEKGACLYYMCG